MKHSIVMWVLFAALLLAACSRDAGPEPAVPDETMTAAEAPETAASTESTGGEAVYAQHCASCHEGGVARAPHRTFLNMMAGDAILASMTDGIMQQQAAMLSREQKKAVSQFLAAEIPLDGTARYPDAPRCEGPHAEFDYDQPPVQRGWGGVDPHNSRYQPVDTAGFSANDVHRLELSWAFALPHANRARAHPNTAGGAVHLGSQDGTVYALDEQTGCVRWSFRASAEVRTAISITPWEAGDEGARPKAFFGDIFARVYALDLLTGEKLWVTKLDDHANATSTGSPVYHQGRVYAPVSSLEVTSAADPYYPCCSFRGSVVALDAASGERIWKGYTIPEAPTEVDRTELGTPILAPSGAPTWNAPTIDEVRGRLYVGTGQNYSSPAEDHSNAIIAFDLETGEQVWHFQALAGDAWNMACYDYYGGEPNPNCPEEDGPDLDFGANTVLTADGEILLGGQKSGEVWALDPDTGELLWHRDLGRGGIQGGIHFGMALAGDRLYVPISDFDDGLDYDAPARPGVYAVDVQSGEVLWYHEYEDRCAGRDYCDPGISAAIWAIDGGVVTGAMDGWLRVHAADTGEVLWEYDTAGDFDTVSGATVHGGSFGGPGPVVVNGALYASSGYGIYYHMPGNVFLRFVPRDD